MTHSPSIVADFAVIMTIAAIVVFLFHKFKQPLILGYLIAGIIIGPYTPPFSLVSSDVLSSTADLGMILLLFGIGLEFPLHKLRGKGFKIPIGISAIEITLMFIVSYGIGWIMGWSLMDSLFLGAALASSSTVIIAKTLGDLGKLKDTSALLMMSILVAEDLFVVVILAMITSIAGPDYAAFSEITWTIGKILLFVIGSLALGSFAVPKIIDKVAQLERDEILVLVALGLCFGLSIVANLLGLSVGIGAFLIGVLVANAKFAQKVTSLTSPIKDMFGAIFFVSMGALVDITQFRVFIVPALIVTAIMMLGKMIGCGIGAKLFGYDNSTSLKVGLGMGQVGEFAFIVVKAGQDLNLISSIIFPIIGIAAAITAFSTPYVMKLSYRIDPNQLSERLKRRFGKYKS